MLKMIGAACVAAVALAGMALVSPAQARFTCDARSAVLAKKPLTRDQGGPGLPPHVCVWVTDRCPPGQGWRLQGSPYGVPRPADHTCLPLPGRVKVKVKVAPSVATVWSIEVLKAKCDQLHLVDHKPALRDAGGVGLPPRVCLLVRDERCRSNALTAWLLEGSPHGVRREDNDHVCRGVPVGVRYIGNWDDCVRAGNCRHPAYSDLKK